MIKRINMIAYSLNLFSFKEINKIYYFICYFIQLIKIIDVSFIYKLLNKYIFGFILISKYSKLKSFPC